MIQELKDLIEKEPIEVMHERCLEKIIEWGNIYDA